MVVVPSVATGATVSVSAGATSATELSTVFRVLVVAVPTELSTFAGAGD
jgi:hypothetical protein